MFDFFKKKPTVDPEVVSAPKTPAGSAMPVPNASDDPIDASVSGTPAASAADPMPEITSMDQVTEKHVLEILNQIQSGTLRDVVKIITSDEPAAFAGSKLGGTPYIPGHGRAPVDSRNRQLRLLAQLRLSELPAGSPLSALSNEGMLQFWVLDDDIYGLAMDNDYTANDTSRVIYYDSVDETITEQECAAKYAPWVEDESYFPFEGEIRILFQPICKEGISSCDYTFPDMFATAWNEQHPKCPITSPFSLPDRATGCIFEEENGGYGHKIGGYPAFTQEDPRDITEEFTEYNILLLQIDSQITDEYEIMWGDMGVGNFFITPKDLERKDFSKVFYTWDCG